MRSIVRLAFAAFVGLPTTNASAQGPAFRADSVVINGAQIYFRTAGTGEPLFLLHGFNQAGLAWVRLVNEDFSRYRLIVPDLRGHGGSTNPSNVFTFREAALDVLALADYLQIEEMSLMGVSGGAMTSLHMATLSPSRIKSMVLIAGTTHVGEEARRILSGLTVEAISPAMWANRRQMQRTDQQIRDLQLQQRAMADDTIDMRFGPAELARTEARTLIIHGDRDQYFPVEIPVEMYRGISGSELLIIPNANHALLGNSTELVLRTALTFLSR